LNIQNSNRATNCLRRGSLLRAFVLLLILTTGVRAKNLPIDNVASLQAAMKSAEPGDNLVLREGEWHDAKIIFRGRGTASAPITLSAATPGKTVLTGKSSLRIHGEYLAVEGLSFSDPDPSQSDLIQFRADSDELARHCRMSNCAVTSSQPTDSSRESRWVNLYGSDNQVSRCTFEGKSGKGATLVVWLGNGSEGRHQIDHNYFGPRQRLGKNGGETIRLGDSKTAEVVAGCVVEQNLFDRCNGETECISNKSCGNTYRDNTFLEVSGTLTLRHGNGCLVENNSFLGNDARGTGGIRIIGEDHVVRGNYLENLTGDDARSAITLMMGIPNSPAHRYRQVERAIVENNSLVNCEHSILIGLSDDKNATLPPSDTIFRANQILSPGRPIVEARCTLSGIQWRENKFSGKSLGIAATPGIDESPPAIKRLKAISRAEVGTSW
jgi:poly(beta-D-mannuronate) lyase